jgi:hypothetical protein
VLLLDGKDNRDVVGLVCAAGESVSLKNSSDEAGQHEDNLVLVAQKMDIHPSKPLPDITSKVDIGLEVLTIMILPLREILKSILIFGEEFRNNIF